ncbi:NtaA/DmoA family FMN-dependent monooxygenase [Microbacterium sp. 18062]|uniref:NtaA/DmoA family FMN-dependent monooxygenase n=1 Tax=Microbacterium sp. 18062 TaxID=2681410 RepID=UPI00135867B8|nr:NtaA/DmoA family FMN-dependent monooxygenase [Microbacterium sp. 18062]
MTRRVHLAAHFPGVNSTTIWSDPRSGSQTDFSSFEHFARTAERGAFDFLFLAEGLRLREHAGLIHDLDVVGRPDSLTVLASVAAVTSRLGLVATLNSTYNEPFELARQLLSLDAVSGGRAGWNVVTSSDAFTGANFRRGGYLAHADRYERASDFIALANRVWTAAETGDTVRHASRFFDVVAPARIPASPQGRPVVVQAGVSDEGRDMAARHADAIFSPFSEQDAAAEFAADMTDRLVRAGRSRDDLRILPAATFVIGDDEADAARLARAEVRAQVSAATAVRAVEAVWGRTFPELDPDGPLPDPAEAEPDAALSKGRALLLGDREATAREWARRAADEGLSVHELAIAQAAPPRFVGTGESIAAQIDAVVQSGATDGFVVIPSLTPTGLDRFVDEVVPALRARGSYPADYEGVTLRSHLGVTDQRSSAFAEQGTSSR